MRVGAALAAMSYSDSQIVAYRLARAAVARGSPVPDRDDGRKVIRLVDSDQFVVNSLPDAGNLPVDLAAATHRTAAGAVHQAFGAAGYRT